nr:hypothetical protein [uncultured Prevotella sp.]
MRIQIFDKSGNKKYSVPVSSGQYVWKLEESDYITDNFESATVLHLSDSDYCNIDGLGRFEIVDLPKPEISTKANGYEYELRMDRPWYRFKNRIHFLKRGTTNGMQAKWSLTDTIANQANVLLDDINAIGYKYGEQEYEVEISTEIDAAKSVLVEYDSTSILDSIGKIAEAFETEWWFDANVLHFGKCQQGDPVTLEVGTNLSNLTRQDDSSQHGTRLYAFGSDRNLNANYRRELSNPFTINGFGKFYGTTVKLTLNQPKSWYSKSMTLKFLSGKYAGDSFPFTIVSGTYNSTAWSSPVFQIDLGTAPANAAGLIGFEQVQLIIGDATATQTNDSTTTIASLQRDSYFGFSFGSLVLQEKAVTSQTTITLSDGTVTGIEFKGALNDSDGNPINEARYIFARTDGKGFGSLSSDSVTLANVRMAYVNTLYTRPQDGDEDVATQGVSSNELMLPVGTPYIDSEDGLDEDSVVEIVNQYDDIYPRALLTITDITEIQASTTDEDTGNVTYWTAYRFKAKLQDGTPFHFDKDYIIGGKTLSIHFESGRLNGMDFEVGFNPDGDSDETFEITRNDTYTLQLPNDTTKPAVGDTLYMYNLDVSIIDDSLISAAENELKAQAIADMEVYKEDDGTYTATTNPLKKLNLSYGQKVTITSEPLFTLLPNYSRTTRVIGWEKDLEDLYSGEYTCGETAAYNRLDNLSNQLDETVYYNSKLASDNSTALAQYEKEIAGIQKLIDGLSDGLKTKLSKVDEDTAAKLITFLEGIQIGKGYSIDSLGNAILKSLKLGVYSIDDLGNAVLDSIKSSNFDEAAQAGFSLTKNGLLLRNLTVWGKAVFHELEIRKVSYSGGVFMFSPAGGIIESVVDNGDSWRCYMLADDGTTRTMNMFQVGDQALCQSFNIQAGTYEDVSNKRYWRKVIAVSDDTTLYDNGTGNKYAWVDLSKTDCEDTTNDAPSANDVIVTLGNDSDPTRQNAIMLDTVADGAPIFALYKGINTYTLEGKDIVVLSPAKVKIIATELETMSASGEVTDVAESISTVNQKADSISLSVSQAKTDAAADATTKANNALSSAKSYADTTSANAKSSAISTAASDATAKANAACAAATSAAQAYTDMYKIIPSGDWVLGETYAKNSLLRLSGQLYLSNATTSSCPIVLITDDLGNPLVTDTGAYIPATDADGKLIINADWDEYTSNESLEDYTHSQVEILKDSISSKVEQTAYDEETNTLMESISDVNQRADSITAEVSQVKTDAASDATDKANAAQSAAINAAASDATAKANNAQSAATTAAKIYTDSQVTMLSDEISSKVSKTDYDSNNNSIQTQLSDIDQKADSISLSVDQVKSDAATDATNKANDAINSANGYTDSKTNDIISGLTRTSIDIVSGLISATSDNFVIKNNAGAITFSVDKDGNIIGAGGATFSGTVVATAGKIGKFTIDEFGLRSDVVGDGGGNVYIGNANHNVQINAGQSLISVRADGDTGISVYTQDTVGIGIRITAQTSARAILSYGSVYLVSRRTEGTYINNLAQAIVAVTTDCTVGDDPCTATLNGQTYFPSLVITRPAHTITVTLPSTQLVDGQSCMIMTTGSQIFLKSDSAGGMDYAGNGVIAMGTTVETANQDLYMCIYYAANSRWYVRDLRQ